MTRRISIALACCLFAALGVDRAEAIEHHRFALAAGFNSVLDLEELDAASPTLQLSYALRVERDSWLALRLGRMSFDEERSINGLVDSEIEYLTVTGEYILPETVWESGFFLGLGYYRQNGFDGFQERTDSELGVTIGTTAEFTVTPHLGVLLELAGHYADLPVDQFFGSLTAGLSWSF